MEDLWKQTILFFLETSGPVFQFFLETSSPVFQFLPGCLARNKTAVLSLTWILMPHSLQRIDGRIGWWDHTKQHSCGSLHRLCLYFKERPTVPWSDDYKLQGALATAKTRSVLMRFPDATKKRLRAFREIKPYLLAFGFIYCLQSVCYEFGSLYTMNPNLDRSIDRSSPTSFGECHLLPSLHAFLLVQTTCMWSDTLGIRAYIYCEENSVGAGNVRKSSNLIKYW